MREAEKEKKNFQSQIPFILGPGKKIPKKILKQIKKFKKLKNLSLAFFLAKSGCDKQKKIEKTLNPKFRSHSILEENSEENSEKKIAKKF